MFEKITEFGINVLSTRLIEVTRQEVTSFFKVLLILLAAVVLQNLLVRLVLLIKKSKTNKSMSLAISSIALESVFFLTLPTLVMLFIFLATMDTAVQIKDYSIVIILIYFFSALFSVGIVSLMSRKRFKKKRKKSKKSKLTKKTFDRVLIIIHLVLYVIVLILFPKGFKWFALMYVLNSLVINLIALAISKIREPIPKPSKNNNKHKKSIKHRSKKRKKPLNS